ncbi:MAG: intein-containing DNA gyrase subunit B, partial [Nanoarchaeota archaeon]|nr:intein-containing DNA gyrase subunit B [Nanoarchaeota archaeon]
MNAEVIKVSLDNNEEIICTPDHLFMLREGSYKPAKNLSHTDSLMPLRKQISKIDKKITIKGYEMVFDLKESKWIFTHLLSDKYNLKNKVYLKTEKTHRHHKDFNKLNNNPNNICRLTKKEHMELHAFYFEKNLKRPDVLEKLKKIRQTKEFKDNMSKKMYEMREELSKRSKILWQNEEYKKYMVTKFLEFYKSNPKYRKKSLKILMEGQKEYWSKEENVLKQAKKVKAFFETHPERKIVLSEKAKQQWNNKELKEWRRNKTREQWTEEFRIKRKIAYNKVYFDSTMKLLREIYEKNKNLSDKEFEKTRKEKNNK